MSEKIPEENEQLFYDLGVEIVYNPILIPELKYFNKYQIFKLVDSYDFDIMINLDTDIVISEDFSNDISFDKFQAAVDIIDPLEIDNWKKLFSYFNISFPKVNQTSFRTMKKTIPYFTSGFMIIPKPYLSQLYTHFESIYNKLDDFFSNHSQIDHYSWFKDQIALTLAVQKSLIPYSVLSPSMNFHTHTELHKESNPEQIHPKVIHYHHRLTSKNNIRYTWNYPKINSIIEQINSKLCSEYDIDYLIDKMYLEILNRPADDEGLKLYSDYLEKNNFDFSKLKIILETSPEYNSYNIPIKLCIGYDDLSLNELNNKTKFQYSQNMMDIINSGRKHFGWFNQYFPKIFEYEWILNKLKTLTNKKILDLGSGITPLPIILSNSHQIFTLDSSDNIFFPNDDPLTFQENGYFDYSYFTQGITSIHSDIFDAQLENGYFNTIFSLSMIENIVPAKRHSLLSKLFSSSTDDGELFLSVYVGNEKNIIPFQHRFEQNFTNKDYGTLDELISDAESNKSE